jgi:hypothetical protein
MSRRWLRYLISLAVLLVLPLSGRLMAQDSSEEARAIAIAAAHPRLAAYLAELTDWRAIAYAPEQMPHVWRVLFQTAQGDSIAEADVLLAPERVLWLTIDYRYMSQATLRKGREAALRFALSHADVQAVLGEAIDKYQSHVDYEAWRGAWSVYLWYAGHTVQVVVRFNGASPLAFEAAELIGITFPEALSVTEWLSVRQARAITVAAAAGEVAVRLREHSGWRAEAVPEGTPSGAVWRVTFKSADSVIAQAWVDLLRGNLIRAVLP